MRRRPLLAAPFLAAPALLAARPSRAAGPPVDVALVLAVDASGSISPEEFRLQREGCAEAVTHPAVLAAITGGLVGAIGITLVEWGAPGGAATVVPWHRVADAASAAALAEALREAPRSRQSWNAIGDAITHAAALLEDGPFEATRQVIDVSGDAPDMRSHRPAPMARDAAVAAGITVNALAIAEARAGLAERYRAEVIGGPGAFVMEATGRADFARALRAKLVREIA
ncbi:DUF1194 domain-containing protein [Roseomonas sp. M0104]|uniref:DUF1194 domain-containing protein n=1 Tax=Teichococcus coralli TaxID=2545983 RepID=A0A845B909_9PROT|nr:DUF1194 domain-containing protein [Pseudoroseomonas coralli]MXP61882.1 DUF1194 domain-containing protein [Pseudoroseomonas coralli]